MKNLIRIFLAAAALAGAQVVGAPAEAQTTRTLTVTGPATVTENDAGAGQETTNYTVTLTGAAFAAEATVTWSVTHGTTEDDDFAAAADRSGMVTFATTDDPSSGTVAKTFTITVAGDTVNEANETFTVNVTAPDTSTAVGTEVTTTITDNDAITYSIAADSANVTEADNAEAEFTVTLSGASEGDVTIPVTVAGTATSGDDYTAPGSTTVTVTAGATTADFDIALINDNLTEAAETIIVTVAAETDDAFSKGAEAGEVTRTTAAASQDATVTIPANDPIAAVITAVDADVAEGGSAVLNVDLGVVPAGEVVVAYTVDNTFVASDVDADVDGMDDNDDAAGSGSITIPAGQRRGTINLAITDDTVNESAETFTVTITTSDITNGGTATITSGGTTTFTIAESDPFTYSISADQTATEADSDDLAVTAEFTVTVTGATSSAGGDITILFTVASGSTAVAADDYSLSPSSPNSLVLDADHATTPVLSGTITVTVAADDLNEAAETVILELGDATFAGTSAGSISAGRSSATLTINDDDRINLAIGLSGARRVEEGDSVTFQVELTGGAPTTPISLRYDITGVQPADYHDPNGGIVTLPATTSANAMVGFTGAIVINVDAAAEPDETLTLAITSAGAHSGAAPAAFTAAQRARVNFGGPTARQSVTINANSAAARTLSITGPATITETNAGVESGDFTITLSGAAFQSQTDVTWTVIHGTTAAADFVADADRTGTVSFGTTDTSQTFTLTIAGDSINEADETFTVRVTVDSPAGQGGTVPGISNTVTIPANDPITYSVADAMAVTEADSGTSTMSFTVTLSAPSGGAVTIPFTIGADSTATAADYTRPSPLSVTVAAGQTTADIEISVIGDNLNEADETITITLGATPTLGAGADGVTRATAETAYTATGMITDNDDITITVDNDADGVREGGSAEFTVNLTKASAGVVTVNFAASISDMGGTPSPAMGSIDIPAGERSGIIRINIPNNDLDMGTRTLTVTLANATIAAPGSGDAVTTSDTGTATVTYRQIPRSFSIAAPDPATAVEGDTVTFTITLSATMGATNVPTTPATVAWTASGAVTTEPRTVRLSTGGSTTVPVAIPRDNVIEGSATLTVTLTQPTAGFGDTDTGISGATAAVTVTDDGDRAPTVTLSGPSTIAIRGNTSPKSAMATYRVSLTQTPAAVVTVGVEATGDPANCGAGGNSACIVLSANSVEIAVPVADAPVAEMTFTVTATDPNNNPTSPYDITLTASVGNSEMGGGTVVFSPTRQSLTVSVVDREPEADEARRVERLKAPLESLARSVGQLAAGAIGDRLRTAATGGGGPLTIGGKTVTTATAAQRESARGAWAANPHVRNGINFGVSGGEDGGDMKEILAKTSFAMNHGGHGGGGVWASGGRVSSDGDTGGVRYNSDTTSWHIGFDRAWNNGLLGVSLAHTDSEVDIDDTMTDVLGSKLESDLLSVHPYMTGQLDGGGWVWATIGYGTGDAEISETHNDNGTVKTDVEVVTAGLGAEVAPVEGIKLHLAGTVANAKLDAAEFSSGRATLRSVNGTAVRVNAGLEGGVAFTLDGGAALRPFITLSARVDSGDGHDGTSLDWGGGMDARTDNGLFARVEGRWQVDGKGPDEEILSLTIRQEDMWAGSLAPYARMNLDGAATGLTLQRGRFGLDMEVGMDNEDGVGLERLLQGRWLF